MSKIKNLLFDLGGVLLNIDYNKTATAFKLLGVKQFDELYSQADANDLFESLETGKISEEDFYLAIKSFCNPDVTHQQIETAWNEMLLNFRTNSLNHLIKLKEHYNIYLLSNTNSIHLTAFNKIFQNDTGIDNLNDYFIKAYYSHLIQERKPYALTYKNVLEDAGIKAEETLFIDDSIKNIKGAKEAGLQVYHLLDGEKIEDITIE